MDRRQILRMFGMPKGIRFLNTVEYLQITVEPVDHHKIHPCHYWEETPTIMDLHALGSTPSWMWLRLCVEPVRCCYNPRTTEHATVDTPTHYFAFSQGNLWLKTRLKSERRFIFMLLQLFENGLAWFGLAWFKIQANAYHNHRTYFIRHSLPQLLL